MPMTTSAATASFSASDYCSFAYSALACFRMGMSGSASPERNKIFISRHRPDSGGIGVRSLRSSRLQGVGTGHAQMRQRSSPAVPHDAAVVDDFLKLGGGSAALHREYMSDGGRKYWCRTGCRPARWLRQLAVYSRRKSGSFYLAPIASESHAAKATASACPAGSVSPSLVPRIQLAPYHLPWQTQAQLSTSTP